MNKKSLQAEPYLKSNIVPDATRYQKTSHIRRCDEPHALWRSLLNSLVLPKTAFKMAVAKEGFICPEDNCLSSGGDDSGDYLRPDSGYLSVKQIRNPSR